VRSWARSPGDITGGGGEEEAQKRKRMKGRGGRQRLKVEEEGEGAEREEREEDWKEKWSRARFFSSTSIAELILVRGQEAAGN
jgi:hypothetical protein